MLNLNELEGELIKEVLIYLNTIELDQVSTVSKLFLELSRQVEPQVSRTTQVQNEIAFVSNRFRKVHINLLCINCDIDSSIDELDVYVCFE